MNQTVTITPENGKITIVDTDGKKIAEIDIEVHVGYSSGLTSFKLCGRGTSRRHVVEENQVHAFNYEFNSFAAGSAEEIGEWN